jgi:vancomycin resistance protein YoaR
VAEIEISGYYPDEATAKLEENIKTPQKIILNSPNKSFDLNTKDIGLSFDFPASGSRAYGYTRTGNIFYDYYHRVRLLFEEKNFGLATNIDEQKLQKIISSISAQISTDPIYPSVKIIKGKVNVDPGKAGNKIDEETLRARIGEELSQAVDADIDIPLIPIDPTLTKTEIENLNARANKFVGKKIQVKLEFNTYTYSDADILSLLNLKGGFDEEAIKKEVLNLAGKINREPQNPKFSFNEGRVTEFQPALPGIELDGEKFKEILTTSLNNLENGPDATISFDAPVTRKAPEVATESVNNLGIKELIGRGTSTYYHSIPSRVHNVSLAASRINGTLVKPGDTFSFNDALGDVSQFTGYQQAYIISGGKTILGDGGGVCQVSTTLFRSLLNAGLPITERAAHAYRVGYYEQNSPPGLDATVYGPTPDLKFTNDTPGYVLIEAMADPKHYSLVFELYGTSDGRIATITKPVVSNISPALPTVYQDDPNIPVGTLKQVDYSAAGARVSFSYTVSRGGITILQKTFISNYRPWAAVYLKGTKPI